MSKNGGFEINSVRQCIGHNGLTCVRSTSIYVCVDAMYRLRSIENIAIYKMYTWSKDKNKEKKIENQSEKATKICNVSQSIWLAIDCNIDYVQANRAIFN